MTDKVGGNNLPRPWQSVAPPQAPPVTSPGLPPAVPAHKPTADTHRLSGASAPASEPTSVLSQAEIDEELAALDSPGGTRSSEHGDPTQARLQEAVGLGRLTPKQGEDYSYVRDQLRFADHDIRNGWDAWVDEKASSVNFGSEQGRELLSIVATRLRTDASPSAAEVVRQALADANSLAQ